MKQLLLWHTGELARALLLIISTQKKRGRVSPRPLIKLFLPVVLVVSTLNSNIPIFNHSPTPAYAVWTMSYLSAPSFISKRNDLERVLQTYQIHLKSQSPHLRMHQKEHRKEPYTFIGCTTLIQLFIKTFFYNYLCCGIVFENFCNISTTFNLGR